MEPEDLQREHSLRFYEDIRHTVNENQVPCPDTIGIKEGQICEKGNFTTDQSSANWRWTLPLCR